MEYIDIGKILLRPDEPMRAAIEKIDNGGVKIAIIADGEGMLLGVVTDGDIRRALLGGNDLDTPVNRFMKTKPKTALSGTERSVLLNRLRHEQILHIPIVDAAGRVRDLAYLPHLEHLPNPPNEVVIMAGGLGTRLRPLTEKIPKPLVNVGGRPLIDTIIDRLVAQGLTRITLCVNYLGYMLEEHLGDGSRYGAEFSYVREAKRMGTAGALSLLPKRPEATFFVMNGDLLTTVDFNAMLDFHRAANAKATMAVNNFSYEVPFGVIEVAEHKILAVTEKPKYSFLVNAGIYLFEPDVLGYVPADNFFDMNSFFDKMIESGEKLAAFPVREQWLDIGRPDDLNRANSAYDLLTSPDAQA